ncbi:efflux RND transporter periplasmic adaptor subunit [Halopseudomonas salegens]|uniref:HlyD family secretion protein n=1 Tax=Halopseudomonas salegens TaxID=1434072 RepID=A0A1H2HHF4_9GAMM|nr:HlyD family efflux transporter periplasmic adaptor subunit [Halopseudomonas salegens]SDU31255.1 HlyD family secretion protein [Halopseudomonas salegens]
MRKLPLPLLIIILAVVIFVVLRATRPTPETVTPAERSWRVDTQVIEPQKLQPRLTLYGQLESPQRFTVVAPLSGRIAELPVRDGQQVAQGELLVALDEADIAPRLLQAEAELADAEAQLASERAAHRNDQRALELEQRIQANAEAALARMQRLVERELAPRAELDNAEDTMERAALTVANRQRSIETFAHREAALQARVQRSKSALESMQRDAKRSRFAAPYDAIVSQPQVAVGDQVNANQALLELYPLAGMEVRATLPQVYSQAYLQALAEGSTIRADTLDEPIIGLTLVRIAGRADASGVEAIFQLDAPAPSLRVGNLLAMSATRPTQENSVALPHSALYGNDTIYALKDGRMHRLSVQRLGETRDEQGERKVLVGSPELVAGMQIVITHLPNAMQGLKVDTSAADEEQP